MTMWVWYANMLDTGNIIYSFPFSEEFFVNDEWVRIGIMYIRPTWNLD